MKKLSIVLAGMALGAGLMAATPAAAYWEGRRHDGWQGHRHHRYDHHRHRDWAHRPHHYGHRYRTPPRVVYVPVPYYYNGYTNW